jgi:hypothetical protein
MNQSISAFLCSITSGFLMVHVFFSTCHGKPYSTHPWIGASPTLAHFVPNPELNKASSKGLKQLAMEYRISNIYLYTYILYIYNNLKDQICTIINYLQHLSEMRKKCWTKYLSMCIFTLPHPCQFLTCNSRKPCLVVQMASMHYHWVLRHGSHDVYMRLAVSSFEFTLVNCYDNL